MGEYSKQLDAYLAAFEKKMKVKLPIPEKLEKRKEINDSIDMKFDQVDLTRSKSDFQHDYQFTEHRSEISSQGLNICLFLLQNDILLFFISL